MGKNGIYLHLIILADFLRNEIFYSTRKANQYKKRKDSSHNNLY